MRESEHKVQDGEGEGPGPPAVPDADLISRARDGDGLAFRALVMRFEGLVYGVARRMVGNRDDAQDICQDVFVRVHRSLSRHRIEHRFSTWLYRVTMNAAIDFLRKQKRRRRAEGDAPVLQVISPADDLRISLDRILEQLTRRQRSAFVLRDLQGLELAEVATVLGCTPVTVRVHLHNARRRVRDLMKEAMT